SKKGIGSKKLPAIRRPQAWMKDVDGKNCVSRHTCKPLIVSGFNPPVLADLKMRAFPTRRLGSTDVGSRREQTGYPIVVGFPVSGSVDNTANAQPLPLITGPGSASITRI